MAQQRRKGGRPKELESAVRVTVMLEERDRDAINALAAEKGISAMALMRKAIRQLLRRHGR